MRNILYRDSKKCTVLSVYVIDLLLNVTYAVMRLSMLTSRGGGGGGGGSGICGVFDHQLHPHPGDFD
jgi:hypothetical protein